MKKNSSLYHQKLMRLEELVDLEINETINKVDKMELDYLCAGICRYEKIYKKIDPKDKKEIKDYIKS